MSIPVPHNLIDFQRMFPNEEACVEYLKQLRWPQGFVCDACCSCTSLVNLILSYDSSCIQTKPSCRWEIMEQRLLPFFFGFLREKLKKEAEEKARKAEVRKNFSWTCTCKVTP